MLEYYFILKYFRNELLKISSPNIQYPALSSSVTVTSSPEQGRYVVATQDIPPGTVILR